MAITNNKNECILSIGSNTIGSKFFKIESSLALLSAVDEIKIKDISSVYKTKPMVKTFPDSIAECEEFLNLVCIIETSIKNPAEMLVCIENIESQLGKISTKEKTWKAREIDIDILSWNNKYYSDGNIIMPHYDMHNRSFVLDPLSEICDNINTQIGSIDLLKHRLVAKDKQAQKMLIVNVTPDSFSDGGEMMSYEALYNKISHAFENYVQIIDIGAQATSPNKTQIEAKIEIERLIPSFEIINVLKEKYKYIKPRISLDSYSYDVIKFILDTYDIDIINDVSGCKNIEIAKLAKDYNKKYVLQHSITIPTDKNITIPINLDPIQTINNWFDEKITTLVNIGLSKSNIIIDPGIGFGKTAYQDYHIIQNIEHIFHHGCRVLVGHSRKSFIKHVYHVSDIQDLDKKTTNISYELIDKGVNILRLHDVY
jgi:2-amino-4-hydroxy-6-hydroxymethyldihydropteridine diphosphokinase/dihydropteroate synthase